MLDTKNVKAYFNRGRDYLELKDYVKAIRDFTEAIRLDPNNSSAYWNRGNAYNEQKNLAQARADFDKAKQLGYPSQ
jgi:tetratricopeptide (TPR) repeat protein